MKKLIFLFLLGFNAITCFGQLNFQQKLGDFGHIGFPGTPTVKPLSTSGTMYIVRNNDDLYLAMVSGAEKSIKDLLDKHFLDSVYAGYIYGSTHSSMKGTIFYQNNIEIEGLRGIEFNYKGNAKGLIYYCYNRAVYLNDTIVAHSIWLRDSLPKEDPKIQSFYNSFKLTMDRKNIRQSNSQDIAYKTGSLVGKMMVVAVILALGFLIIFILKKIFS